MKGEQLLPEMTKSPRMHCTYGLKGFSELRTHSLVFSISRSGSAGLTCITGTPAALHDSLQTWQSRAKWRSAWRSVFQNKLWLLIVHLISYALVMIILKCFTLVYKTCYINELVLPSYLIRARIENTAWRINQWTRVIIVN